MIDESGSFLVCRHGVWYRNGELQPQTFTSDNTLSDSDLKKLEEYKNQYFNLINGGNEQ